MRIISGDKNDLENNSKILEMHDKIHNKIRSKTMNNKQDKNIK